MSEDQEENQSANDQQSDSEQKDIEDVPGAAEEQMAAGEVGQVEDVEEQLTQAKTNCYAVSQKWKMCAGGLNAMLRMRINLRSKNF